MSKWPIRLSIQFARLEGIKNNIAGSLENAKVDKVVNLGTNEEDNLSTMMTNLSSSKMKEEFLINEGSGNQITIQTSIEHLSNQENIEDEEPTETKPPASSNPLN
jgi:hypothetical protein